jgi:hypothetical protein
MNAQTISAILDGQRGVTKSGETHVLAELEATVFVGVGGDLAPVPRVVRVELKKEFAHLSTAKDEHYFFEYAAISGLKLELPDDKKKSGHGAGFR